MSKPPPEPTLLSAVFKDLHVSIVQLLGGTIGAGISIPITQGFWKWFVGAQRDGGEALGLGVYTLLLSIVGTWLFLGLFGRAARRFGGRPLQFIVQVTGIAISAWMSLPTAVVVTFIAMLVVGRDDGDPPVANQ